MTSLDAPNLDSSQEQSQSDKASRTTIILWLVVVSLAAFFLPLYLISSTFRSDATRLEANLLPVQATLQGINTPPPDIRELMTTLSQVQGLSNEINGAYTSVLASRSDWPAAMAVIGSYNPAQLTLNSLTESDNQVTLDGRAIDESAVVAYARTLEESELFSRVVIQSVRSVATPFVTPTSADAATAEPTPTGVYTPTATPTPTPNPRDQYEIDDFEFQDIILGQPQSHNFHPFYDVDKVKFLAKAGRYYKIYTFDLTPGVDTFLTASLDGTVYTNDDRQPGELASEIFFQVGGGRDVDALVKITNRGLYNPDMWYQITVVEIVPTPTPTPTDTPEPTSTAEPTPTGTNAPTAIPTDTPVPANTPTFTPDLRDDYEPDDTSPKPISVGESQMHSFYPNGDVDKVSVTVKQDRHYRIRTLQLEPGVDTNLVVTLGDDRWENDDYDLPGSGNFASLICFEAPVNGVAEATITNRDQQYAPDKYYVVEVHEAPVLDVSPSTLNFGPMVQGGANPASQQINVTNIGADPLAWSAAAYANEDWLNISSDSGTAPSTIQVSVDVAGLTAGNYAGTVVISGTTLCTQNTPFTVSVNLEITTPAARLPGLASWRSNEISYLLSQSQSQRNLPAAPGTIFYLPRRDILNSEAVEFVIVLELKR